MTREDVKDLLKADDYVQDRVEDIAEMCHKVLDGQFGEIVPHPDVVDKPFAIVTNTKTGKWFRVEKGTKKVTRYASGARDITFSVNDIKDTIPVIGTPHLPLSDCLLKKELIGDNEELHIEIFNADKVKQDEYFLYNAWIIGIDSETNEITLSYDWVK